MTKKNYDSLNSCGLDVKNTYALLAEAAQTLFNRQVTYMTTDTKRNRPEKRVVRWVSGISYVEGAGIIKLRFSPEVIPLITELEKNFTSYELEQVSSLTSAYAVRLYELLIAWRSVGKTPVFELDDFRSKIGLEADTYKLMSDFKKRVLDHSITQINTHTDITVTYEQHKSGRIITGFSFTFKVKNKQVEPKKVKKETVNQTDSKIKATTNNKTNKIATQFIALNSEQQTLIINHIKTQLSGLKKSKFNIEWDTFKAVGSQTMFEEFYENFAKALVLLNIK